MHVDYEEQLKELIAKCGDNIIDISKIGHHTNLMVDFNFNSVNFIQLIIQIEDAFHIELDDEDLLLEKLSSYKNLLTLLKTKLGK